MKSLSDQDHYEILESHPRASADEIERCYRMALATYADDSLAGYSVFSDGDNTALRERIEIAFRVLSDRELRREYDTTLGIEHDDEVLLGYERADAESLAGSMPPAITPEPSRVGTPRAAPRPPASAKPAADGKPERELSQGVLEELDDGEGDFDGSRLRRYRLRCGLELEDIAGTTKINPSYLRFIEDEQFSDLPAPVYVRGFVNAYATCLGLDAPRVAESYMSRLAQVGQSRRKGRFFESR